MSSVRRVLVFPILCALFAVAACSTTRAVPVQVSGVKPMNVNAENESTPVNVRLFALIDDDAFRAATVDQLWTDPKSVLGDDLMTAPSEITVFPGEAGDAAVKHAVQLPKMARYLGVLALYAKSDAQDQRSLVVPIDALDDRVLRLTGFSVQLRDRAGNAPAGAE